MGHPVLEEILEKNHSNICSGNECLFVWIPGHSGIAGNVRADYWAKKAIEKPNVTNVGVACNEYVPMVKKCVREHFARQWQEFRHTHRKLVKPEVGEWSSCVRDNRKEEVVLCRLRLGHTVLTHSHVIDHDMAPSCDACRCPLGCVNPDLSLKCFGFRTFSRAIEHADSKYGVYFYVRCSETRAHFVSKLTFLRFHALQSPMLGRRCNMCLTPG